MICVLCFVIWYILGIFLCLFFQSMLSEPGESMFLVLHELTVSMFLNK